MEQLILRYPALEVCRESMHKAFDMLFETYCLGGKILLCGNGGSCCDCEHIVGELMKGFMLERKPSEEFVSQLEKLYGRQLAEQMAKNLQGAIPAISLPSQASVISAFSNDVDADMVYAQLVYGYAKPGDTVVGLTTSGNSLNVVNALMVAKSMGVKTLALTGNKPSKCDEICDCVIKAPESETYKVQEYHLPIYHWLCAQLEKKIFKS
ncbi:MAG: SIS domain-containing protein [Ruminococcaceae bacterium]|nr:SIS domain-containing protein [Oscillospiraceae bacterium]